MDEIDCYRALYGSLVHCVPHYTSRHIMNWESLVTCASAISVDRTLRGFLKIK